MLKLMKMEVIENSYTYDADEVFIEFEYQTNTNDTITFEFNPKYKEVQDLKIYGVVGLDVLEELQRLIQDATITINYSDYI